MHGSANQQEDASGTTGKAERAGGEHVQRNPEHAREVNLAAREHTREAEPPGRPTSWTSRCACCCGRACAEAETRATDRVQNCSMQELAGCCWSMCAAACVAEVDGMAKTCADARATTRS
jgi:hypothetical protein